MGTVDDSVTTNTKHQSTKAYNMVKGENGTMDRGQNRTTEKKYAPAETLGPDGGPLMPKSAPGAAGGPSGKETSTHHLFPSKMVKTEDKAGADDGGAHAQDATIGTPGGGTQYAPRPTPGATAEEAAGEGLTSTTVQVRGPTVDKTTERDKNQNTGDSTDTTQQHRMTLGTVCDIFTRLMMMSFICSCRNKI